jgi:Skp family chaperone for outer membrane proteins
MRKAIFYVLLFLGIMFSATGYVDTSEVLQSYNKAIAAQADLVQKQQDVQDFFTVKQKEYERLIKADSTEAEILQIRKDLEKAIEPQRQELADLNKKLSNEIEKEIITATELIAKQLRLDVVVDKKAVLVGGTDITGFVISKLNNTKAK